jgi:glucokinase
MKAASEAAGFDIGGQTVKAARVDLDGRVLSSAAAPTGSELSAEHLAAALKRLLEDIHPGPGLAGTVGVGVAGVTAADGTLLGSPNLPALEGAKVARAVSRALGRKTVVENDANCAALAEGWGGAADGCDDFLLITLGSGLGSGLVMGGGLYRGAHGHGCELGHAVVVQGGRPCGCGAKGCLEAYVSEAALHSIIAETGGELALAVGEAVKNGGGHARALFKLAGEGDRQARVAVSAMIESLGVGLASAVNVLDVTTIVIGGGIGPAVVSRKAELEKAMAPVLFARAIDEVRLLAAARGPLAGAIGAARLAMLSL